MEKILIAVEGGKYEILLSENFGELESSLKKICENKKILIVTNEVVANLYLEKFRAIFEDASRVFSVILKDGERFKNYQSVEQILEAAFTNRLNRNSIFIALGGGVVGDITGFASGIFMRGVPFIQVPTTLLAQVDASVGGKTGINNAFGKNLVGLFHQPKAVFVGLNFLETLPKREFSAGVAEIIKMAVCFDGEFFNWLESNSLDNAKNLEFAIKKSIEIKAKVVNMDERESGIRAGLNYGHTFGHVVENLTNYTEFLHGEAVSIGMCMANELAFLKGNINEKEREKIKNLLTKYNLPTHYEIKDIESFYAQFFLDKKSSDGAIKFVLPKGIGDLEITDLIPKNLVLESLKKFSKN